MPHTQELIALEHELIATRNAAVRMVLMMAENVVTTDVGRVELARSFDAMAETCDSVTARVARLVAEALRRS